MKILFRILLILYAAFFCIAAIVWSVYIADKTYQFWPIVLIPAIFAISARIIMFLLEKWDKEDEK